MIYFDNGATTFPKPPKVYKAVSDAMRIYGANPGRSGHRMSLKASDIIYSCRNNAAELFGIEDPSRIVFTLNCTEALNIVIKGILKPGDHAVISSLEHNAVVRPLEFLSERGVEYSIAECVPYDDDATIDNFRKAVKDNTKLVICTHASNVFGIKLPVERIGALCRIYDILFCVDAAQSAGAIPVSLNDSCIDFLCCAGHKGLYGPMGTGMLIINTDKTPQSLVQGGTGSFSFDRKQPEILPDKYESGTPNLPGIAGLNEGIKFVLQNGVDKIASYEMRLARTMYKNISAVKNVRLYTEMPDLKNSVSLISFNIADRDSEEIASLLDKKYNIAVRAGLHCATLAHESFKTDETGTVRAVLSAFNNMREVNYFSAAINKIAKIV